MSSVYPPSSGMASVPCKRCQAPLFPNEATCRNCGYYNAPAYGNNPTAQGPSSVNGLWGEGTAQPSYGQNQKQAGPPSWGQFPVSPPSTPSPPEQNLFNTPPPLAPKRPAGRNFFGVPSTPSSSMEENGYAANQSAPSSLQVTPPPGALQRPAGLLSMGPISGGLQAPGSGRPASQAPYGVPSGGPVSQAPYGMSPTGPASQVPYGVPSGGPVSQAPYGVPPGGPVSQASYGMPPAGFQQSGAPAVPGQPFPGVGASGAPRMQPAGPQSFAAGMSAPPSVPDVTRFAQPATKKTSSTRRLKPWMIVLTVLLLIVLGGGAFAGYTLLLKQNKGAATATTAPGESTQNGVLFADTFKNNANHWNLQADPGIFSISVADGSLVLEDDVNEVLWESLPGNKTFGDFTLSADAMLAHGDQINGYGFYIRGSAVQNSEMADYYRFELYGDGSYAIFKGSLGANGDPTSAKLANYALSSAIHKQGVINHITITAKGSSLSLLVNGKLVKTITDASYMSGSIAPFVSNLQNAKPGAQARFSNLTISGS